MSKAHLVDELDRTDYRILDALQSNGRMPVAQLARTVNLSVSPCWQRLKWLERSGVIRRYTAEVALEKLIRVQIVIAHVILSKHSREAYSNFDRRIRAIPEAVECYEITGHIDFHLKFVVPNIERYQEILETLLGRAAGVEKYFTYVVTRASKDERAVRIKDMLRES
jgi:DNA-binding Lrp family transcriptional regulator